MILEGPLTVGTEGGGDSTNHSPSGPPAGWGEGVEVFDNEVGLASMWALTEACDLISWSLLRMRFEVVARGPFGPGFKGFFA